MLRAAHRCNESEKQVQRSILRSGDVIGRTEEFDSMFNRTNFSSILKIPLGLLSRVQKLIAIIHLMTMKLATNSSQLFHLQASLSHSAQTPYGQRRPFLRQTGPASYLARLHGRRDLFWSSEMLARQLRLCLGR